MDADAQITSPPAFCSKAELAMDMDDESSTIADALSTLGSEH